jgi:hypothetical protein
MQLCCVAAGGLARLSRSIHAGWARGVLCRADNPVRQQLRHSGASLQVQMWCESMVINAAVCSCSSGLQKFQPSVLQITLTLTLTLRSKIQCVSQPALA